MAYRKSIRTLNKERKREWSRRAVAAKERKRMERVSAMTDVGGITTDGILGEHSIRILSYGDGGRHYAITVDGEHRQARTERGILRCVAQMIFKQVSQKDMQ
ncbi:MAG TPA: hypothetical protein PLT12_07205 [Kiritimatiellia bacterium]|nr:hypothetical protein [Kiritimatiellia bacterium]HPL37752.1 hypothetical protein [Verrucomicrobiota bacterium]